MATPPFLQPSYQKQRRRVRRALVVVGSLGLTCVLVLQNLLLDSDADESDTTHARHKRQESTTTAIPLYCQPTEASNDSLYPPDLLSDSQIANGGFMLYALGMIYMFVALAIVCDEFFVPSLGIITDKMQISEDVAGATFMAAGGSAPELFTSLIGIFIAKSNVGIGTIVGSATFNILFVIGMCCLASKGILHLTWWPLFRDVSFYIIDLALLVQFFTDQRIMWYEALVLLMMYFLYVTFMKFNEQLEYYVKKKLLRMDFSLQDNTPPVPPPIPEVVSVPNSSRPLSRGSYARSSTVARLESARRRPSVPVIHGGSMFRNGIVQLMVHTLDPLSETRIVDGNIEMHAVASLRLIINKELQLKLGEALAERVAKEARARGQANPSFLSDEVKAPGAVDDEVVFNSHNAHVTIESGQNKRRSSSPRTATTTVQNSAYHSNDQSLENSISNLHALQAIREEADDYPVKSNPAVVNHFNHPHSPEETANDTTTNNRNGKAAQNGSTIRPQPQAAKEASSISPNPEDIEDAEEPLDMSWPEGFKKQALYIFLAPITGPLWICVPDVRRPEKRKYFIMTFIGSILFIAFYSYLMVWFAAVVGKAAGLTDAVMGLTFLAAGTSIPDLITSVIVARKGFGDMAVSSSVGSNIFDVCVGLPFPWLLYIMVEQAKGFTDTVFISVDASGLVCSVGMLFIMLLMLIFAIGLFKWRMNKIFGIVMLFAYVAFSVFSVMMELKIGNFRCPFSTC